MTFFFYVTIPVHWPKTAISVILTRWFIDRQAELENVTSTNLNLNSFLNGTSLQWLNIFACVLLRVVTIPFRPKPNQNSTLLSRKRTLRCLTAEYEVLTPGEENSRHQWKCWES